MSSIRVKTQITVEILLSIFLQINLSNEYFMNFFEDSALISFLEIIQIRILFDTVTHYCLLFDVCIVLLTL